MEVRPDTVKTLRSLCSRGGGKLVQVSRANQPFPDPEIMLAGDSVAISRRGLWRFAGIDGRTYADYSRGWIYDRYFPPSDVRDAFKADDPFGAYGCAPQKDLNAWAVALMPAYRLPGGAHRLLVFELTPAFARELRTRIDAEERERQSDEQAKRDALFAQRRVAERERLSGFRSRLAVGSDTHCGMVLQTRGSIVEVQLPGGVVGPGGEKQFWVHRDALTDDPAPQGCTFGR